MVPVPRAQSALDGDLHRAGAGLPTLPAREVLEELGGQVRDTRDREDTLGVGEIGPVALRDEKEWR